MRFYEVFMELISHGKAIGKTCIQVSAESQFTAAMEAETIVNGRYGENIFSHTLKVTPISESEYIYSNCIAA